jgi:hypothetical protein
MFIELLFLGGIVVTIATILYLNRKNAQIMAKIPELLADLTEKATPEHPENTLELKERLISLERRMEMLEEDAKKILARANTRLRRAESVQQQNDEDEANEDLPQAIIEQVEQMENGLPEGVVPDHALSLAEIRQLARS